MKPSAQEMPSLLTVRDFAPLVAAFEFLGRTKQARDLPIGAAEAARRGQCSKSVPTFSILLAAAGRLLGLE
jgi:hypothetical protein